MFFRFLMFFSKLIYLVFTGLLCQAVLLISFNTLPIGLPYSAVGTWPERSYWV